MDKLRKRAEKSKTVFKAAKGKICDLGKINTQRFGQNFQHAALLELLYLWSKYSKRSMCDLIIEGGSREAKKLKGI